MILSSDTEQTIFFVVVGIWLLSEIIGAGLIPNLRRHGTKLEKCDRGSRLLFYVGMFVSIEIANLFVNNGIALLPNWFFFLGISLMILGIIIRQWSIAVLGRFFSSTVGTQEGQKVVDKGPYKLIRHPAYTGYLLTLIGLGLAWLSWGAVIAILIVNGCILTYRISVEEKVLITNLGNPYIEYMKKTKRIIPYVL